MASRYGKGRVVVCTTTLGRKWNSWQISPTFLMIMVDLQKWLMGTTGEANLIVGTPVEIRSTPRTATTRKCSSGSCRK